MPTVIRATIRSSVWVLLLLLIAACGVLPKQEDAPSVHLLEWQGNVAPLSKTVMPALQISAPSSYPAYGTSAMAYRQSGHELRHFARNRWADHPARMIGGAMTEAISDSGLAPDVHSPGSRGMAPLRLETELIRLEQWFEDDHSEVRLTLRYRLIDQSGDQVLGSVRHDIRKSSEAATPQAGVAAANAALNESLERLIRELPRWK